MNNQPYKKPNTSWENSAQKYHQIVGEEGHYYHKAVVIPKSLDLLKLSKDASVLDLGCGQGVFSRVIPKGAYYYGVDISKSLINTAKQLKASTDMQFNVQDITKEFTLPKTDFSHCLIILALQNVEEINVVMANAARHLESGGKFLIVLNHPAYRIPRQSSWGIDEQSKLQYRKVNKYMSPMKIPIDMAPGAKDRKTLTWSFHFPLSTYSDCLAKSGFYMERIEEWVSDKQSAGKHAKMENRARDEFPMFMAILAAKR